MSNPTLDFCVEIIPQIKQCLKQDTMIGLTDGEKFIAFWEGTKMKAPIQPGDLLKSDDPMITTFKTGQIIDVVLPPHIHGFPFRSVTGPIRNKEGKIVGTLGIGCSLELTYNIENIVNNIEEKLQKSLEEINNINKVAQQLSEKSQHLMQFMDEILQKTTLIDSATKEISSISTQTQILAINASIEATHAGLLGKGFSVVAQEMRNLATTSQNSSNNIFNLIDELSKQIKGNYSDLKILLDSLSKQQDETIYITKSIKDIESITKSIIDVIHNE